MSEINKRKVIPVCVIIAAACILIAAVFLFLWKSARPEKTELPKAQLIHDAEKKTVSYRGDAYTVVIDYNLKFQIAEYIVNQKNILAEDRGICVGIDVLDTGETFSEKVGSLSGYDFTSLQLDQDPVLELNEDDVSAAFTFESPYTNEHVLIHFKPEGITLTCTRTFKNDCKVIGQAYPSVNLEQDAIESIRWARSGASFWIGGKATDVKNYLCAGAQYAPETNIKRAMEDICFTLLSGEQDGIAVSFAGSFASAAEAAQQDGTDHMRLFGTEVQRYESGERKHLEMNVFLASDSKNTLRYLTGTKEGWPSIGHGSDEYSWKQTGRVRLQGYRAFSAVKAVKGTVNTVSFQICPQQYGDYYELGDLNGVDEVLLSQILHDFSRTMIMDYDLGAVAETPGIWFELPPLEQHWITNIYGVLRDDAALETQMNAMRVIRDKLQAADGHLLSAYPYVSGNSWGHNYADMGTAYILSVCGLYNLTGDRAFADEMRVSMEKALAYQYETYLDPSKYVCTNMERSGTKAEPSYSDYWEHTRGGYNGYTTVLYYDALRAMADMERLVYGDSTKADRYDQLAGKIRKGFNEVFWDEEHQTFLYFTGSVNTTYLPVLSALLKTDIVPKEKAAAAFLEYERQCAVFDLKFHPMNVYDLYSWNKPCTYAHSNLGMDGGWYGCSDGDYYAGFPIYGDRTLLERYINHFTELFEITGFSGYQAYQRDGVTPAQNYDTSSFPTHAAPVWGLYTYGYGFQPACDSLRIAPFISENMAGSSVKYRWRGTDLTVTYDSLYSFTVETAALPADIYVCFLNQTAGKDYEITINGTKQTVAADQNGTAAVRIENTGRTAVTLTNPDPENRSPAGTNLAAGKPAACSSTYFADSVIDYWSVCLTDGSTESGFWRPANEDTDPYIRVALGRSYAVAEISCVLEKEREYRYVVEGTNDPRLEAWSVLADRRSGKLCGGEKKLTETISGTYSYIRITFIGGQNVSVSEICIS